MHHLEFFTNWLLHHGKIAHLDGIAHRITVETCTAIYPYKQEVISVQATPVNRSSKHYLEEKKRLGDDWSVSVLDSDVEIQSHLLSQLELQESLDASSR